jgi:hypothetical protein
LQKNANAAQRIFDARPPFVGWASAFGAMLFVLIKRDSWPFALTPNKKRATIKNAFVGMETSAHERLKEEKAIFLRIESVQRSFQLQAISRDAMVREI